MSSPYLVEVLANRFRAIADQMAVSIQRTAFSVYVKETRDFAAGLCTSQGEVFGFPTIAPPMMLGSDASSVIGAIDDLSDGDIVATNDPISSGAWMTHLNDVHLLKPVFVDGRPIFYLWAFLHLSDVGGRVPGSISTSNRRLVDEGFRVPPRKLYRAGVIDQEVAQEFLRDSRTPNLNRGDINALVAALNKGEEQSLALVERYGAMTLVAGAHALLEYGERKARAVIGNLNPGSYSFTDYLELQDPKAEPVPITVKVTVDDSNLHLDFTGTGNEVPYAYNLLTYGKRHGDLTYGAVNFLRTADPAVPANAGLLRPIGVKTQPGSIVNPTPGVAIGARMATVVRTMEAVYGALGQVSPLVPVASGDRTLVFMNVPSSGGSSRMNLLQPVVGGSGARTNADGIDGVDAAVAWLRNVPTESLEREMPVLVRRYRLAPGHAEGRYRGGHGTDFEFTVLSPQARIIARNRSRRIFRPWGRAGGSAGGHSRVWLNPGTDSVKSFDVVDALDVSAGDTLRFVSGYGAAIGSPRTRDPARIALDVTAGFMTRAEAVSRYGVGMPSDTKRLTAIAPAPFTRGPELIGYEAGLSATAIAALVDGYARLLPWDRAEFEERVWKMIRTVGFRSRDLGPEDLRALLDELAVHT